MSIKRISDIREEYDPPMQKFEWVLVVSAVIIIGGIILLAVVQ